jgi:hypothetical protein
LGTTALSKQNVYAPVTQQVNIGILSPCPAQSPGGDGMRAAFCGISDLGRSHLLAQNFIVDEFWLGERQI